MAFDTSKFIKRFVEEAREHVNNLNKGLLAIEKGSVDSELINSIFRSAHTIKGSSRMLKLIPISELAHKLEDALGALRDKRISLTSQMAAVLYRAIDEISSMIEDAADGKNTEADRSELMGLLELVSDGKPVQEAAIARKPDKVTDTDPAPMDKKECTIDGPVEPQQSVEAIPEAPTHGEAAIHRARPSAETLRINADRLNELIRLASELSSSHSRLKQRYNELHDSSRSISRFLEHIHKNCGNGSGLEPEHIPESSSGLRKSFKSLTNSLRDDLAMQELLIRDLQERTLGMRMMPLSTIFDSFYRTTRELASAFGKKVELIVEGDDTEMDKKIIEKMGDPLLHMFRNSIDHGIETPEERQAAGKPDRGTIRLTAGYEGSSVLITMSDDGRGISLDRIRQRAVQKGIVTEDSLSEMSDTEIRNLIFTPGFSTSQIITDISGRGVGMDVVRSNIVEDLKGSIEIETTEGKGTTFHIRLPLTLAIMHVVLVRLGNKIYAFPDNFISEIIRINTYDIIDVLDKRAISIREQLVPVEELSALLRLKGSGSAASDDERVLLIANLAGEKLGLFVDAVIEEEDMVIKSLPLHMKNVSLVSGVIITGRDEVVLVLNIPALFVAAKETKGMLRKVAEETEEKIINVLVVDDSINTREIEKSILEAYGYRVTLAEDGMEAFEKAMGFNYDIVITDVEMPKMDGFTLTERLRGDDTYRHTPIILLTSRDKEEDKRRGIKVGANAYILKGDFEQSNLLETVKNLIV